MKPPHRREFLQLAAGAAALPTVSRIAWAQAYPSRPVCIVVGFGPGASPDITARVLAQWLSERLGQQFVIENRPGAGGNLAAEAVVKAQPDGYSLLWLGATNTIGRSFYAKLNFDIVHDIIAVGGFVRVPLVMLIHPSVPAETISQFVTYAKANPGKLNMGSAGNGSASHVAGELLKLMTGIDMLHVPYRGNPLPDLLGGQIQVYFAATTQSIAVIRAKKVRALGITTTMRSGVLPTIPSLSEFVPGYEASTWQGIGAPKKTPIDIVSRLNMEINAALRDPKIRTRLGDFGGTPFPGSPAEFSRHIVEESDKWAKVLKFAGIKAQ
jgi:tripartite-type tricarboxylate transporter receptor subunit TctC